MSTLTSSTNRVEVSLQLKNDKRDIKDLWNDALKEYNSIVGRDLKMNFKSVDDMFNFAVEQGDIFSKWRHDGKRLDKLRHLFMENIGYIEIGTQKLIAAATPAFPPAAAIGTALTLVVNACKGQSADYDVVANFFGDMNSFLQRVSILEGRLPDFRAYQACLMDVFTSFLTMCAFATKFIAKGRFKTWVINSFLGQDADLSSARQRMDKNLGILQSATEFAVLTNTEILKGGQKELEKMQQELNANLARQYELAQEQSVLMEDIQRGQTQIQYGVDSLGTDVQAILAMMKQGQVTSAEPASDSKDSNLNRITTDISPNADNIARFQKLRDTRVAAIGEWLVQTPTWKSWSSTRDAKLLLIKGPRGIGKSYTTATAYAYLQETASTDPDSFSIVTYFYCDDDADGLRTFKSFISDTVLQISNQNSVLRDHFSQKLTKAREAHFLDWLMPPSDYLDQLIVPAFDRDSKYQLYIVVDDVDKMELHAINNNFAQFIETINELDLRIKILATMRSTSAEVPGPSVQLGISESVKVETLNMGNEAIVEDIKVLTAARMQKVDETYGGLAHLNPKSQNRIAASVQENASTLLYVDVAFRYLCSIGREGAILRLLSTGLPMDTNILLRRILDRCIRRLPQDLTGSIQLLLTWLTHSFDSLDLDLVNELLRVFNQDDSIRFEDEIEYAFGRILQIGPATKAFRGELGDSLKRSIKEAAFAESNFDDGNLVVSFRNQPVKEFLSRIDIGAWDRQSAAGDSTAISAPSHAVSKGHRTIFLQCCKILKYDEGNDKQENQAGGAKKLKNYAMKFCLRHWQYIECDKHEAHENLEVCDAFHDLIADRHGLAAALEPSDEEFDEIVKRSSTMSIDDGHHNFLQVWQRWAGTMNSDATNSSSGNCDLRDSEPTTFKAYWTGSCENSLLPLLYAHMDNWLIDDRTNDKAISAFIATSRLCSRVPFNDLPRTSTSEESWRTLDYSQNERPKDSFDRTEDVYSIRALYCGPLISTVHFATATILNFYGSVTAARYEFELAAQKCNEMEQKAWIYLGLGLSYWTWPYDAEYDKLTKEEQDSHRRSHDKTLNYMDKALALRLGAASSARTTVLIRTIELLKYSFGKPQTEDTFNRVGSMLQELRARCAGDTVDGFDLLELEMTHHSLKNDDSCLNYFIALSPAQRLSLAIGSTSDLNKLLVPSAAQSRRLDDLKRLYGEILDNLNLGNCGIIWYRHYVEYLYRVIGDLQLASTVLKEASKYMITSQYIFIGYCYWDTAGLVEKHLCLASDVAYKLFKRSDRPDTKVVILQDMEAIPLQRLLQTAQINTTSMLPYLTVLARMQRRVSTPQTYQATLQQAFDICWANLHDEYISNDSTTIRYLAKLLAIGPGLQREAEIISSAQLYKVDKSLDIGMIDEDDTAVEDIHNQIGENGSTESAADEATESEAPDHTEEEAERDIYDWDEFGSHRYAHSCSGFILAGWCPRSTAWETWSEPMYTCLCCAASYLCQHCYDERIKRNESGMVEGRIEFCCDGGEYLKAPMVGWKGIKDGVIYIENEEPIEFHTFLDQLREKWKQAWSEFWKG